MNDLAECETEYILGAKFVVTVITANFGLASLYGPHFLVA